MIEDIELPHLPECLPNLPLETLHEIQSHTYHAIKADRQQRGELVGYVEPVVIEWLTDPERTAAAQMGTIIQKTESIEATAPLYTTPQHATPALEPSVPDGWRLVPVEPTEGMRDVITSGIRHDHMVSVYQAMLAAAPKFGEGQ